MVVFTLLVLLPKDEALTHTVELTVVVMSPEVMFVDAVEQQYPVAQSADVVQLVTVPPLVVVVVVVVASVVVVSYRVKVIYDPDSKRSGESDTR